jgi:hypothetical protein
MSAWVMRGHSSNSRSTRVLQLVFKELELKSRESETKQGDEL